MQVLWQRGASTVSEVRKHLAGEPAYTVATFRPALTAETDIPTPSNVPDIPFQVMAIKAFSKVNAKSPYLQAQLAI